uniref:Uncharacterized protein n=1 Tax=Oryza meridionalis TaxID=40149 RepID=A0A0E0CPW7_9ORYZ
MSSLAATWAAAWATTMTRTLSTVNGDSLIPSMDYHAYIREDIIKDIFLHHQVKIALRCRAINLQPSDTDTTSSPKRD